jgi:hypothetical protein
MALTDDVSAVDSLPVALVGTVILLAVIVALAAFGVRNASSSVAMASVGGQVNAMANDCRFLLALAARPLDGPGVPPGATRIERLDLPEGIAYLSFGYDPDTGSGHEGTIYYNAGGSKKAIVVDERMRFRAADGSSGILRSGRYYISIEYARDAIGNRYLLISGITRS